MITKNKFFYYFLFWQFVIILFIPKVYVTNLLGFNSPIKPEDILWVISSFLVLLSIKLKKNKIQLSWMLFMLVVFLSCIIHFSNLFIFLRFLFYSFPILLIQNQLKYIHERRLINLFKVFIYFSFFYSILVFFFPLPYFHTGELDFGPVDRFTANFGNGVEAAAAILLIIFILYVKEKLNLHIYLMTLVIILLTQARLVLVVYILFGLFLLFQMKNKFKLIISLCLLLLIYIYTNDFINKSSEESRFSTINITLLDELASLFKNNLKKIEYDVINSDGYCFEFNDDLSFDQSFAMRLSKANFVIGSVVLGNYPLGHGFGYCIGDAGDNLFIRILNDGGIPVFIALLLFLSVVTLTLKKYRLLIVFFIITSLFYDTFYFSRVAPLFFLLIYFCYHHSNFKQFKGVPRSFML